MLLRGSSESEARSLTIIGAALVLCASLIGGAFFVYKPFAGLEDRRISVTIDLPYIGQGVAKGTALVMHGVGVGEVTGVSNLAEGAVRLEAELQPGPAAGLTNTMNIDFRPVNYFGVTGINLIPNTGGQELRDGMRINTVPKGNFTLQALLYRFGEISNGTLIPKLIQVIDRGAQYIDDGLDPLIETMLIAANAVTVVQTVSTAQLLNNTTEMSIPFPALVDSITDAAKRYGFVGEIMPYHVNFQDNSEEFQPRFMQGADWEALKLFGAVGTLEKTHVGDLYPLIDSVKSLTDVVPPLIRPEGIAQTLVELRSRFEKMYAGTPEQRALQVRIVLDELPGVAAPLGVMEGG